MRSRVQSRAPREPQKPFYIDVLTLIRRTEFSLGSSRRTGALFRENDKLAVPSPANRPVTAEMFTTTESIAACGAPFHRMIARALSCQPVFGGSTATVVDLPRSVELFTASFRGEREVQQS